MFDSEIAALTAQLKAAFERVGIPSPDEIQWSPTPFRGQWGVGSPVAFQAASLEGAAQDVPTRAREIASLAVQQIEAPPGFDRVVAQNGYINGFFDTGIFAGRVVDRVLEQSGDYGRGDPKAERVMVEYAQPNTHHSIHIGHARNFVLGESLARMVEFSGYPTIRASYPGDIGLGVMTAVWAYQRFHDGQEPEGIHARGQWLSDIYSEAHDLIEPRDDETPEERSLREQYDQERRELYRAWDRGDPQVRALWEKTRQWSLDEFQDILEMLGAKIDVHFFESEVDEPAKQIVEELIKKGIAEDERPEGPVLVKIDEQLGLKKERYRTIVLLRRDGTTLYSAKDLALAKRKFEQHHVDRSIYVVDVRQSLHFQQVFKILELWGFPQASKCHHLAYGFVTLPEGAMSSRHGTVVWFKDVADEAERRVAAIIAEKNPELTGKQRAQVARQVGLGALAYALVSVDNIKDMVFRWETALNFDGQSAPYIQNAHVRAGSILRKAGQLPDQAAFDYTLEPLEAELIDRLSRFPEVVARAAEEYKPLHMSSYAYELAKSFHAFYHAVPVIQSDRSSARLRLTAAARQVLASSLYLLTIEAPEVM